MEKHILIPTDFSQNARNALDYAISLYRDTPATFYLLNAFQLFHLTTDSVIEPKPGDRAYEEAKLSSEQGLKKLVESTETGADQKMHKFEWISTYNNVLDAIKEIAEEKNMDLIVMGTKGENNPINVLYGSNAVNVMEKIDGCPVLVVPEKTPARNSTINEVVFATNFRYFYKRRELSSLQDIVRRYNAAVRILYIEEQENLTEEQETNREVIKDILSEFECSFHTLTHIKVASGIHSFIESRNSGLLALYNRKHGFLTNLFSRSLIKEIEFIPQVPVLVLKEQ